MLPRGFDDPMLKERAGRHASPPILRYTTPTDKRCVFVYACPILGPNGFLVVGWEDTTVFPSQWRVWRTLLSLTEMPVDGMGRLPLWVAVELGRFMEMLATIPGLDCS